MWQDLIEKELKAVKFGQMTVNFQVHGGKVVGFIGNDFERRKYKEDGATEAIKLFLDEVKKSRTEEDTGTISVTYDLRNGKILETLIQKNFKKIVAEK
jgi:hypothetical protein